MSLSQFFKPKYLLTLICLLFLITRLYKITEIPPSVYWDEASIGYNAYSIAQTGKDEWGKFFPIHFRAFGEFKLPVYIYSVVPFVKLFGLNEFSVRIPAVLFSLGVVIITYLLAKKITGDANIGLWSSLFISISPWFFIFSRTGYEVTAGLMFYMLAIYLFFSIKKNKWNIFFSVISFILSAYSYNSLRIINPLTFIFLIFYQWNNVKEIVNYKLPLILSIAFVVISVIPIYRLFVFDAGISRFQAVGSLNPPSFVKNYILHFSPDFLLYGDKNLRSQQAGFGQIYIIDLALFAGAILFAIKKKAKHIWLFIALVLVGPIPAAITKESPHALRSLASVPFISIISAVGMEAFLRFFSFKGLIKRIVVFLIVVVFLIFFTNYYINFLTAYPVQSTKDWQYGYKKIFIDPNLQREKAQVLVSDKDGQPYIFALFYLKYDPGTFRREVVRNSVDMWGFSTVKRFGRFEFGQTYEK